MKSEPRNVALIFCAKFQKQKQNNLLGIKVKGGCCTNSQVEKLKSEYRQIKHTLPSLLGNICCACGETGNIEYHHILPLRLGGDNRLTNIVPLCQICHAKVHEMNITRVHKGGRQPIELDENTRMAYLAYIHGEIGAKKLQQLVAPNTSKDKAFSPTNRKNYKEFLKSCGIKSLKNFVDVRGVNSTLSDGAIVGNVEYLDGRCELIFYRDTGMNDIEYQKRRRSTCC